MKIRTYFLTPKEEFYNPNELYEPILLFWSMNKVLSALLTFRTAALLCVHF